MAPISKDLLLMHILVGDKALLGDWCLIIVWAMPNWAFFLKIGWGWGWTTVFTLCLYGKVGTNEELLEDESTIVRPPSSILIELFLKVLKGDFFYGGLFSFGWGWCMLTLSLSGDTSLILVLELGELARKELLLSPCLWAGSPRWLEWTLLEGVRMLCVEEFREWEYVGPVFCMVNIEI